MTEADFRQFPDDHTDRRRDEGRFKTPDFVAFQFKEDKVICYLIFKIN